MDDDEYVLRLGADALRSRSSDGTGVLPLLLRRPILFRAEGKVSEILQDCILNVLAEGLERLEQPLVLRCEIDLLCETIVELDYESD